MKLTGRLIAAARALAGVSRDDFAGAAGLSKEAYTRLERKGAAWLTTADDIASISRSLAHFGILVVEERDGQDDARDQASVGSSDRGTLPSKRG